MTWMLWFFISNDVQPVLIAEYPNEAECHSAAEYAEEVKIYWCIPTSPFEQ